MTSPSESGDDQSEQHVAKSEMAGDAVATSDFDKWLVGDCVFR
jgi:hypothetical protein